VGRDANDIEVIWVKRELKYFRGEDSTAELLICPPGTISGILGWILRAKSCRRLVRREMNGVAIAAKDVSAAARRKMAMHRDSFGLHDFDASLIGRECDPFAKTRKESPDSRRENPAVTG
jgi:hypothetical protein